MLNTPCSDLLSISEGVLCLQVKVVVLHHAVMMSLLAVSCRMGHCGSGRAKAWLTSCKDVADSFATSLVLRITSLTRRISSTIIALNLDVLESFI